MKVVKRNKEERTDNNFSVNDTIHFNCKKCGKEASKRYSKELDLENLICKTCQTKKTKKEKYGDENYNNREKVIQTNLERYGVESHNVLDSIKEKKKNTFLERYGLSTPLLKKEVIEKNRISMYEKQEKIKQINLERHGVEYPLQSEDIRKKSTLTNIKKYGKKYYSQSDERKEKVLKIYFENLKAFKDENLIPLFTKEEYNGVDISNKYEFKCKVCGTEFEDHLDNGRIPRCPTCFPLNRSKGEIELAGFLKEHVEVIENDRELINPKEIDILIPSLKIAIEYNGEFWHQNEEREESKKQMIEDIGYSLIIVWENEWLNNKEKIKEILLEKINYTY